MTTSVRAVTNLARTCRDFWPCFHHAARYCNSVVEFGCGNGNNLRQVKAPVRLGVEIIPEYPKQAEGDAVISFLIGDALTWAYKLADKSFDLVLLIDVVEHFEKDKGLELLLNAQRIGRAVLLWAPEGVCIQDKDHFDLAGGYEYRSSQDHLSQWYASELETLGFDVARWENYHYDKVSGERNVTALFATWESHD